MDVRIIERARDGDRDAFGQLAAETSDRLFALALRVLRDGDAAGDVLQAALVQIWRDLPSLRDPERFEAWSYRVTLNCSRAHRRRARRVIQAVDLAPDDAVVGDSQASIAARDELERAFRTLSDDQRAVLVLLYYRDLAISEIAAVLDVSPGTVKSRLHYARLALRAALDADARSTVGQERTA